jgi:hypothetical protein
VRGGCNKEGEARRKARGGLLLSVPIGIQAGDHTKRGRQAVQAVAERQNHRETRTADRKAGWQAGRQAADDRENKRE